MSHSALEFFNNDVVRQHILDQLDDISFIRFGATCKLIHEFIEMEPRHAALKNTATLKASGHPSFYQTLYKGIAAKHAQHAMEIEPRGFDLNMELVDAHPWSGQASLCLKALFELAPSMRHNAASRHISIKQLTQLKKALAQVMPKSTLNFQQCASDLSAICLDTQLNPAIRPLIAFCHHIDQLPTASRAKFCELAHRANYAFFVDYYIMVEAIEKYLIHLNNPTHSLSDIYNNEPTYLTKVAHVRKQKQRADQVDKWRRRCCGTAYGGYARLFTIAILMLLSNFYDLYQIITQPPAPCQPVDYAQPPRRRSPIKQLKRMTFVLVIIVAVIHFIRARVTTADRELPQLDAPPTQPEQNAAPVAEEERPAIVDEPVRARRRM